MFYTGSLKSVTNLSMKTVLLYFTFCVSDWCYQSQFTCDHQCNTPDKWDHVFSDCKGKHQSPINIVTRKTLKDERLTPFQFNNYQQIFRGTIKNNGHSAQVGVPHVSTITGGGLPSTYKAVQFHLHWGSKGGPGSEHTIDGERYPMELHIVHMKQHYTDLKTALADTEGVAVLGFFYEVKDERKHYNVGVDVPYVQTGNMLIPSQQNLTSYYRYKGSLTTPGCSQSVIWTVFEKFSELKFHDGKPMVENFRPVQPLNGRQVYRSGSAVILASSALLVATLTAALGLSQPN
uniref:Carbonic anhydrase n=1 Tax=Anabas testudineus TaxID=64144 RepID=A0A7N6FHE3_ANATE